MTKEEIVEDFLDAISEKEMKKLIDVGFTREQAAVLIKMMRDKAISGGFL